MPTNYYPVGWTMLKFTYTEEVVYKIFATWRWSNEEWKLSSGAADLSSITKTGDILVWPQASGSISINFERETDVNAHITD